MKTIGLSGSGQIKFFINLMNKKLQRTLFILSMVGFISNVAFAKDDLEIRCSSTVYKDILITHEPNPIKDSFSLKLCNKDRSFECGSKKTSINGMPIKYKFNAYLTNEVGQKPEVNIEVLEENVRGYDEISIASRDLKNHGFLGLTINNDTLLIGCGLNK